MQNHADLLRRALVAGLAILPAAALPAVCTGSAGVLPPALFLQRRLRPEIAQLRRLAQALAASCATDRHREWAGHINTSAAQLVPVARDEDLHDAVYRLRSPLTAVVSFAQLIRVQVPAGAPAHDLAQRLNDAGLRLADRIDALANEY